MNLAIIPARGGSKGLPGKNIRLLNGKPLIVWSIEAAKKSKLLDRVLVSTDSEEIAKVAETNGCEVLMRSPELASDEATTISVIEDISKKIPEAKNFIVLQPTSPFRNKNLIDDCIAAYLSGDYTNLATGFWCKYKEFGSHNNLRRQDYKGFFYDDGSVYILSKAIVSQGKWFGEKIYRFENSKELNFEIDDEIDFKILEMLMKEYSEA
ncbi:acylneuraminate cytidylyltransferase family protein [Leptospira paudalimensis]|uniref:Acylneuraminate cytidylyltransferase family protein n=1 Tax=Leptospira paudalimensis TaxID=2950024 RepID=A0ABT3M5S3_9LEPT|nr:acylneuraminate cytidylyltransferase family protein [Leptospira paudalimensis]MCW7503723.1 acylneuraminate cytidylyltransferase family protein [Leptospira paudalimensis]